MIDSDDHVGHQAPKSAHMHPGPGFRYRKNSPVPPEDLRAMFEDFEVAEISDQLNRLYAVDSALRRMSGAGHRLIGRACTVRVFPGDNLMVHKALDIAQPGDVVIIDARGSCQTAVLGDTICTKALHRGIAGYIVDGFIRDLPDVQKIGLPVFARGDTPTGPMHRGPGEINYPITCGGVVVHPNDIVIADDAGIVVIPQDSVQELYRKLREHAVDSNGYKARVIAGQFSNAWVDDILSTGGCLFEP